ncbi:MAG: hypothetical protein HW421_3184 [Ignavibacteria bacterium]|nr:hypothetical protein [Ignavibacteria bacterium]
MSFKVEYIPNLNFVFRFFQGHPNSKVVLWNSLFFNLTEFYVKENLLNCIYRLLIED